MPYFRENLVLTSLRLLYNGQPSQGAYRKHGLGLDCRPTRKSEISSDQLRVEYHVLHL